MNSDAYSPETETPSEEIQTDNMPSIDDFIKELEEKEKDLHISSESVVEIEQYDSEEPGSFDHLDSAPVSPQTDASAENRLENDSSAGKTIPQKDASGTDAEAAELRRRLAKIEKERAETNEAARRKQADYENYRNRVEREKGEVFRSLLGSVATVLLPVLDNLNRALDSAASLEAEKSGDFARFVDGIGLVNQQLADVLGEMGVQPISSVGQPFDPRLHEAVAIQKTSDVPPQTVVEEMLRGYRLDDKVIRHAMVKVSSAVNS